jgi:uncharacterized cupredoxin-like copper-binding protein
MSMLYKTKIAISLITVAMLSIPAFADSVITVSLKDKGGTMDLSKSMGLGMGMKGDMKLAIMSVVLDKSTVPAGKITFKVKNVSKETVHEMILAPVKDAATPMPFIENEGRVDEDKMGDIGEVSELEPGKSGTLAVSLKPGTYILYCNVPGHYMAGMWTTLTVK